MALTSSGQLKFSEIQTEFGGSNPISFSEYYSGGTIIAASLGFTGRVITNVPATGMIKVSNFYSAAKGTEAAASADVTISITAGSSFNTHGYDSISGTTFGSIASGSATAYDGATIKVLREHRSADPKTNAVTGRGFTVVLAGTRAQGFFTSIDVGSQNLASSSASHSQSGGNTTWTWSNSSSYTTTLGNWVSSSNDKDVDFNE